MANVYNCCPFNNYLLFGYDRVDSRGEREREREREPVSGIETKLKW